MQPAKSPFSLVDAMEAGVQYGPDKLRFNLPDQVRFEDFRCSRAGGHFGFQDFTEAVRGAEAAVFPINRTDLIIVNDAYRPTPTALIIDWLTRLAKLNEIEFLVATGTHAAPDDKQLERYGVMGGNSAKNRCS
jgi:hypothetical protein